jgi:ABC-type transport system involved in multi-copper enzyme maturation permease subunit
VITFLTEIRRMRSRRLLGGLGAIVLLAIAVSASIAFFNSSRDTAAAARAARAERRDALAACERGEFHLPGQDQEGFDRAAACRKVVGRFEAPDPRWSYATLPEVLLGVSPLLGILSLVLGASFIGAEWQKGTMTTSLTWEPRRVRLLVAKLGAAALVCFGFALVTQVVLAGALWPVAALRGSTSGLDGTWAREVAGVALRVAVIGSLTAVAGGAIATVGRNTTAALGIAFVYFAVVEGLIRGFRPRWQPWLLGDNAAQFVSNQAAGPAMATKTTLEVAVVLLAYAALLVTAAAVFFTRRDVT